MIMIDQLDLIDSYRELVPIYVIHFVVSLYLILLIGVQTFEVIGLKFSNSDSNRFIDMLYQYLICCLII